MSKELQAGYKFTKSQLARLKLLEKQNEIMLKALYSVRQNSIEYWVRNCADGAIVKVEVIE